MIMDEPTNISECPSSTKFSTSPHTQESRRASHPHYPCDARRACGHRPHHRHASRPEGRRKSHRPHQRRGAGAIHGWRARGRHGLKRRRGARRHTPRISSTQAEPSRSPAPSTAVEQFRVVGRLEVDLAGAHAMGTSLGDEARRRIDGARGADGDEEVGFAQCPVDSSPWKAAFRRTTPHAGATPRRARNQGKCEKQ